MILKISCAINLGYLINIVAFYRKICSIYPCYSTAESSDFGWLQFAGCAFLALALALLLHPFVLCWPQSNWNKTKSFTTWRVALV
jgi:hypothetical protein